MKSIFSIKNPIMGIFTFLHRNKLKMRCQKLASLFCLGISIVSPSNASDLDKIEGYWKQHKMEEIRSVRGYPSLVRSLSALNDDEWNNFKKVTTFFFQSTTSFCYERINIVEIFSKIPMEKWEEFQKTAKLFCPLFYDASPESTIKNLKDISSDKWSHLWEVAGLFSDSNRLQNINIIGQAPILDTTMREIVNSSEFRSTIWCFLNHSNNIQLLESVPLNRWNKLRTTVDYIACKVINPVKIIHLLKRISGAQWMNLQEVSNFFLSDKTSIVPQQSFISAYNFLENLVRYNYFYAKIIEASKARTVDMWQILKMITNLFPQKGSSFAGNEETRQLIDKLLNMPTRNLESLAKISYILCHSSTNIKGSIERIQKAGSTDLLKKVVGLISPEIDVNDSIAFSKALEAIPTDIWKGFSKSCSIFLLTCKKRVIYALEGIPLPIWRNINTTANSLLENESSLLNLDTEAFYKQYDRHYKMTHIMPPTDTLKAFYCTLTFLKYSVESLSRVIGSRDNVDCHHLNRHIMEAIKDVPIETMDSIIQNNHLDIFQTLPGNFYDMNVVDYIKAFLKIPCADWQLYLSIVNRCTLHVSNSSHMYLFDQLKRLPLTTIYSASFLNEVGLLTPSTIEYTINNYLSMTRLEAPKNRKNLTNNELSWWYNFFLPQFPDLHIHKMTDPYSLSILNSLFEISDDILTSKEFIKTSISLFHKMDHKRHESLFLEDRIKIAKALAKVPQEMVAHSDFITFFDHYVSLCMPISHVISLIELTSKIKITHLSNFLVYLADTTCLRTMNDNDRIQDITNLFTRVSPFLDNQNILAWLSRYEFDKLYIVIDALTEFKKGKTAKSFDDSLNSIIGNLISKIDNNEQDESLLLVEKLVEHSLQQELNDSANM